MKQAIVVLGMHRSGTSSVAGALATLGAASPRTLMPRHPTDNPKGYWESLPLVKLNDQILASAGSSWMDWRKFNPDWSTSNDAIEKIDALTAAVTSEFAGAPLIVLKDPRICRLFFVWRTALSRAGYAPLIVMPIRSPVEVASSLAKRDKFSHQRSYFIWLRHVLEAEKSTRDLPRCFVFWKDFISDWRAEIVRISDALDLTFPNRSDFSSTEVDNLLDVSLRRNIAENNTPTHGPLWVEQAYEALASLEANPSDAKAMETLDLIREEFDRSAAIYGPVFAGIEQELNIVKSSLRSIESKLSTSTAEAKSEIQKSSDQQSALNSKLSLAKDQIDASAREKEILSKNLEQSEQLTEALKRSLAAANEHQDTLAKDVTRLRQARNDAIEKNSELQVLTANLHAQLAKIESELSATTAREQQALERLSEATTNAERLSAVVESQKTLINVQQNAPIRTALTTLRGRRRQTSAKS